MATRIVLAGLLISLVSCSGCGGGGSSGATPVTQSAAATSCTTIALYGDSTNDGTDGATRAHAAIDPQQALQTLMDARFGAGKVAVVNKAIGGTTSNDLAAVGAESIAVVNFGINDALKGVTVEAYKANLRRLYRPGVVFKTPNPIYGTFYYATSADDSAYAAAMREVAAELHVPVIDTNSYVLGLQDWQALLPDGIHPTTVLYGKIAEASMQTLAPLITCR